VTAIDAPQKVDIENLRVPFTLRDGGIFAVLLGLDIDRPGGTGSLTEQAADATLQTVFITVQNVTAPNPIGDIAGLFWILRGDRLLAIVFEGDAETLTQGDEIIYDSIHSIEVLFS